MNTVLRTALMVLTTAVAAVAVIGANIDEAVAKQVCRTDKAGKQTCMELKNIEPDVMKLTPRKAEDPPLMGRQGITKAPVPKGPIPQAAPGDARAEAIKKLTDDCTKLGGKLEDKGAQITCTGTKRTERGTR